MSASAVNPTENAGSKPGRRNQKDLPTDAEMERLRSRLKSAITTKAIGNDARVPALLELCRELGLPTIDPNKPTRHLMKPALLELLDKWVGLIFLVHKF